jgi:hypothetical protein
MRWMAFSIVLLLNENYFLNSSVSSFIWFVFISKNCVWKFSRFSFDVGFNIRRGGAGMDDDVLAINVFGGMCSCIGRCSKLRLIFLFVVDVY